MILEIKCNIATGFKLEWQHIKKRKKGITATVRIKPHPSQSQTFTTMRDAKAWAQELELKIKNEKKGDYDHILFRNALEEYRDNISISKKGVVRERTRI
ncbi:hypothetical protein OSH00_16760 [Acinetobacter sp. A-IN1]|uniref:Integrase n=1 Tax=Acinetobacter nematophilus TaxID=2994642 RepID=A0A9X3DXV2_9GAMM|nr:hypothetical protein [Acinetobacter nematophilus]MCX5469376.1 hypothetical protein [Acinetobacter nematophilus]